MLKVGDILWVFDEKSYSVYEISELTYYHNLDECHFYFIVADVIIGNNTKFFTILALVDYNNLVKLRYSKVTHYYTTSEKEAVKFIESHYNEIDN